MRNSRDSKTGEGTKNSEWIFFKATLGNETSSAFVALRIPKGLDLSGIQDAAAVPMTGFYIPNRKKLFFKIRKLFEKNTKKELEDSKPKQKHFAKILEALGSVNSSPTRLEKYHFKGSGWKTCRISKPQSHI